MIKKIFFGIGMSYSWMGMAQFGTTGTPAAGNYYTNTATKLSIGTGIAPAGVLDVKGDANFAISSTQVFKVTSPTSYFKVDQAGGFASYTNGSPIGARLLQYNGYLSSYASLSNQSHAFTLGTIGTASGLHFGTALNDVATINSLAKDYSILNASNNALILGTNNVERMRILNNGNIGIGTSTPSSALDVSGDINASKMKLLTGSTGNILTLSQSLGRDGSTISFSEKGIYVRPVSSSTYSITMGYTSEIFTGYKGLNLSSSGSLGVFAGTSSGLSLGGNKTTHMTIDPSGNIGIGTATPTEKLEIAGHILAQSLKGKELHVGWGTQGGGGNTDITPSYTKYSSSFGGKYLLGSVVHMGTVTNYADGTALIASGNSNTADEADLGLFAGKAKKLVLGGNRAVHMTIQPSGKVGIGVAEPTANLDVAGESHRFGNFAFFGGSVGSNLCFNASPDYPGDGGWGNSSKNAGYFGKIGFNASNGNFEIGNSGKSTTAGQFVPYTGMKTIFTLTSQGQLGLGVATPSAKLHVGQLGSAGTRLLQVGDQTYFTDLYAVGALGLRNTSTTNPDVYLQLGLGGMVVHGNAEKFSVGKFSGVDGGTYTPIFNLRNNGTLAVKELCTNPNMVWCDYVFAKDYKLRKLSEVESYINEHQHLPEIPASAEVEKDGIKVAEMLTLQMKKIEELTLYLIAQEKRIQELESQLKSK